MRQKAGLMDSDGEDQGSDSTGYGNRKQKRLGRQEQGIHMGRSAHG